MSQSPLNRSRRHFLAHAAGASAMTIPALSLGNSLLAKTTELRKNAKSAILLWMDGGPSTIDLWDLKPNSPSAGEFKLISTTGDMQIGEHLPMLAKQMHNLSIVRSMSTREADHTRGRYYMKTGFVPNPSIEHPTYGSVVAHELADQVPELQIPPFVSIGNSQLGAGFLGMSWAPFNVDSNGQIRNLQGLRDRKRVNQRYEILSLLEQEFEKQQRGSAATDHRKILSETLEVMTSTQMSAFEVASEEQKVKDRYGNTNFGRGCLMARRLVEAGVPFIEVNFGGWDNHQNIFPTLRDTRLPDMDRAMSALVEDLKERGRLESTAIIWMGEFGRTPRINGNAGRDHWARAWSVVVGGGKFKQGIAVGKTNEDGTAVETTPYTSQDLMASVCHALDIPLKTTYQSKSGRPMKIANGGKIIKDLFA
ncbi:MAG: DUF1501 domain-containing protein [Pirellulaceae bacterium]|nr:DUF1501 domain-containing protein [Pirellulaceae bacterium]